MCEIVAPLVKNSTKSSKKHNLNQNQLHIGFGQGFNSVLPHLKEIFIRQFPEWEFEEHDLNDLVMLYHLILKHTKTKTQSKK